MARNPFGFNTLDKVVTRLSLAAAYSNIIFT